MYLVDPDLDIGALDLCAEAPLRAPYAALEALFGPPRVARRRAVWALAWDRDPTWCCVLRDDLKRGDTALLEGFTTRPWYQWSLAAEDDRKLRRAGRWVAARVIGWADAQPRTRELTVDGRAALNGLLAAGVPLDEALSRAGHWQEAMPSATLFSWPVR